MMMNVAEQGGTDLGRRILEHRHRAGLSREEAATRAGMAPSYLKYLETSRSPNPDASAVARLEDALGLSAGTLAGVGLEMPPGRGSPGPRPGARTAGPRTVPRLPWYRWRRAVRLRRPARTGGAPGELRDAATTS